jgi:hypothetical protein
MDALKSFRRASFVIPVEFLKSNVVRRIDDFDKHLSTIVQDSLVLDTREKINVLKKFVLYNEVIKANNYLLRCLKPKLTGITPSTGSYTLDAQWLVDESHLADCISYIDGILVDIEVIGDKLDSLSNMHPTYEDIALHAYYTYLNREIHYHPMELSGNTCDFTMLHFELAKVSLFLQLRFSDYLEHWRSVNNINYNDWFFTVDHPPSINFSLIRNLKTKIYSWRKYLNDFDSINEEFRQEFGHKIPNFGNWNQFITDDAILSKIVLNARKIKDLHLDDRILDWFLAENTLLLERFSQPYQYSIHVDEMYLLSEIPYPSRESRNLRRERLIGMGIDSLALLSEFKKEEIMNMMDLDDVQSERLLYGLSKIIL